MSRSSSKRLATVSLKEYFPDNSQNEGPRTRPDCHFIRDTVTAGTALSCGRDLQGNGRILRPPENLGPDAY